MKIRAFLELCRLSNLPTVWSNAVLGVMAGAMILEDPIPQLSLITFAVSTVFALWFAFAMSLIYCGGMALNDYVDRAIDTIERPSRPIPSGRIKPTTARNAAAWMMIIGALLIMVPENALHFNPEAWAVSKASLAVAALLICVLLYNATHQATALSVVFMALCRSMIVISGVFFAGRFSSIFDDPQHLIFGFGPALTLFAYTVLISIVARHEMRPGWFGGPKTVMNMIAAMPLLDALWLLAMGLWPVSLFCIGCAAMTKLGHRKIAGS